MKTPRLVAWPFVLALSACGGAGGAQGLGRRGDGNAAAAPAAPDAAIGDASSGPAMSGVPPASSEGGGDNAAPVDSGTAAADDARAESAAAASEAGAEGGSSVIDPGAAGDGDFTVGPSYPTQPELTDLGAPKGKAFHFMMDSSNSAIFKGTDATLLPQNQHSFMRAIDVYVPARHQDGAPAPLLVIQDGPGELAMVQNALDNLTISQDPMRRLPAFVAVAVQNGGGDSIGSERGLEYDTMSDRYARFVEQEVLPAVLADAQIRAAYPGLSFTSDPEGRATLGCSSGGAAALIMGWFRPDLFHRIVTYSGTFVDQQNPQAPENATYPLGAWDFHSDLQLIVNSPPKPLRVFLNANQNDNGATAPASGHHNWLIANQLTAAALRTQGYHYRYVFGQQAGHCQASVQAATLADSLVWAWRGYTGP